MYLLSRISIYLYVFMFYPAIVNMYLNKKARRNTLLLVISLNTIFITLFNSLLNKITFDGLVVPAIFLIIIMTAIFVISGMVLSFKTPKFIFDYEALMETLVHKKENSTVREITVIEKIIKNSTIVGNILLVIFVFSFMCYIYFMFIHKTNGLYSAIMTWDLILLGANCFSWKLSRDSLNKLIKK